MATPVYKTRGELRAELQARLGYGNQGPASRLSSEILASFLTDAHALAYWQYKLRETFTHTDLETAVGQTLYDWPDQVDPKRRCRLSVHYGGIWVPLTPEIGPAHDSFTETAAAHPQRYDVRAQIEIWPTPDAVYPLRIEHYLRETPFSDDRDRCLLPDRVVFNLALYLAKNHYRHPDAQAPLGVAEQIIAGMRAGEKGEDERYIRTPGRRRSRVPQDPYPLPQRV